ncbi:competence protein ComFC [Bacillus sp. SLBN-46]|uniref:ComF family protein n=1 Tax=Bacillus sp. SLBN-46 TaxID=3042283 RepID=UPI0028679CFB|nr:ComF family protein [Bacillus sp. SLBN-46]MDR6121597.1 competence protein ComFC [Bacillus sp. SLBN-46]
MYPIQSDYCLICHSVIMPIIGWRALFSIEKEKYICSTCEGKLEKLEGEACRICGRPFHLLEEKFQIGDLCYDCFRWEEDSEWKNLLEKNHSLFHYNEFLKEVIAQFKFRGDYVLVKIFVEFVQKELSKMDMDVLVPIPLSEERLYERGFNQAKALIVESGFSPQELLTRVHSEKQSKKSRSERIHVPQVFRIEPETDLAGKRVILIDDVYTTGSTLRHAAKLLKDAGAESIQSLTLAR